MGSVLSSSNSPVDEATPRASGAASGQTNRSMSMKRSESIHNLARVTSSGNMLSKGKEIDGLDSLKREKKEEKKSSEESGSRGRASGRQAERNGMSVASNAGAESNESDDYPLKRSKPVSKKSFKAVKKGIQKVPTKGGVVKSEKAAKASSRQKSKPQKVVSKKVTRGASMIMESISPKVEQIDNSAKDRKRSTTPPANANVNAKLETRGSKSQNRKKKPTTKLTADRIVKKDIEKHVTTRQKSKK